MQGIKIGDVYKSNFGEYEILEIAFIDKYYAKHYKIKFLKTGFENIVSSSQIRHKAVKDYLVPSVYGVGFLGTKQGIKDNKIMNLWRGMLGRCYSKSNASYGNYGAKGVRVCERWLNYSNFEIDVKKLEGYNEEQFYNKMLELDKDLKQSHLPINERTYSPDTCIFITSQKNNILAHKDNMRKFVALSPNGGLYYGDNINQFAKEHNLEAINIYSIFNTKKSYSIHGWAFGLEDCSIEELKKNQKRNTEGRMVDFIAIDPEGNKYDVKGIKQFTEINGLNRGNVQACLSGKRKSHKGWKFRYKELED